MPGGNQSTTNTSTTNVAPPSAVNPGLNSLYNSLFGGAAGGAVSTLSNVANGTQLTQNIGQLYNSLYSNSQGAFQTGIQAIKASTAAAGNSLGTASAAETASYSNNYIQNLNTTATQMGLSELGTQVSAAEGITNPLASSANQYYSPSTSTSGSGNTSLPWSSGVSSIAALFG